MAARGGLPKPSGSKPRVLAFYLPQYHPIPENDEWWGKGFTEWINVTKARPLYPGHYQPHVPGELGYYDLRVPEVREAQAELAREHGISGFVYYHYWFHGRRLLERPFEEVLKSGAPDFPFALCWANEPWTRNWDSYTGRLLMPQEFSDDNDLEHIRWLGAAFADERYIKVDGRPLILIYRPTLLPDAKRMTDRWRSEAQRLGFPDLYLCWVESWGPPPDGPEASGFDASVGFMPLKGRRRVFAPLDSYRNHEIIDYVSAYEAELKRPTPDWKHFPSVMVGWDNTPRRQHRATIFDGATPDAYGRWLRETVGGVAHVRAEENLIFIVAWNEWAEGNHLEPDRRYGRGFLEATRAALLDEPLCTDAVALDVPGRADAEDEPSSEAPREGALANAIGLLGDLSIDTTRTVVGLGAGVKAGQMVRKAGFAYHALEADRQTVDLLQGAGVSGRRCDLSDFEAIEAILGDLDEVGALLLVDVVERLAQPQELLSALSAWSLKHGEPVLVASVPNVAHMDVGMQLLSGRWDPTPGALDPGHLRFFTQATLEQMFDRCGWQVVARDDVEAIRSEHYDATLEAELPEEMIGALRVVSETYNPRWATERFVWALAPRPVKNPPASFLEAVGHADRPPYPRTSRERSRAVTAYLASVGLVVSETNRRVADRLRRRRVEEFKHLVLRALYSSPRSAAAFKKVYSWFR